MAARAVCALLGCFSLLGPASGAEEQPLDVRENVILMRQEMQRLSKDIGAIQQMLEAMPRLYVPRPEHDMRDRAMDKSAELARLDERMRSMDRQQKELADRTQNWLWDVVKIFAGIAFGGAGALGFLRNVKGPPSVVAPLVIPGLAPARLPPATPGPPSTAVAPARADLEQLAPLV